MLKRLFIFFDSAPWAYWTLAVLATALVIGWTAFDVWRQGRGTANGRRGSDALFAILALLHMVAWRWPVLLGATEFCSDESQQIAAAMTVQHDPAFWRSVDAATAGPGDIFALLPVHLLGVPLDFFCARLTGLLLVWAAVIGVYFAVRYAASGPAARLGCLPAALFAAFVTEHDLVYYTTEHAPIFLIGVALWLLWRALRQSADDMPSSGSLYASAAIAGMLPWAKLQSVPYAAALVGSALAVAILSGRRTSGAHAVRRTLLTAVAALTPTIIALVTLATTDQFETFWRSYIVQNALYVSIGGALPVVVHDLALQLADSPNLLTLALTTVALVATAAIVCAMRSRRPARLFWFATALVIVAIVTVLSPRRAFPHYMLFLVPALALWGGAAMAELWPLAQARLAVAALLTFVAAAPALAVRLRQPAPHMIGQLLYDWQHPRREIAREILQRAQPGDTLAIWGWSPTLYVETGLPQAVRDGHVQRQVEQTPQQGYFIHRYADDLRRTRPGIFVDVVGPGCFPLEDREHHAHERYPEIAEYVAANYTLVKEIQYARIYLRKDRVSVAVARASHPLETNHPGSE